MTVWGTSWGAPCAGFGWIFPLIGLIFMIVMIVVCTRTIGRMVRGGWMCGCRAQREVEDEDLRNEVREMRSALQRLSHED